MQTSFRVTAGTSRQWANKLVGVLACSLVSGIALSVACGQAITPRVLNTSFTYELDSVDSSGFFDEPAKADFWTFSVGTNRRLILEVDRSEFEYDPYVWLFAGTITNLNHFSGGSSELIDTLDTGFLAFADDGVGPLGVNRTHDPRLAFTIPAGITNCTVVVTSFLSGVETGGTFNPHDGGDGQYAYRIRGGLITLAPPSVRATHLFYNNSAFDGNEVAVTPADDLAIATDKAAAYRAGTGQAATYAHYSNYSRGLNGIMIDVLNLPGTPTAADFEFRVGNNDNPSSWTSPPSTAVASVVVRRGAGVDVSDRITIVFADNAIRNQWLQVRMLNTVQTGVGDVHYWGHQLGETNTTSQLGTVTVAVVDVSDISGVRNNPRSGLNPAPVDFPYDLDRNQRVDVSDIAIVRNNPASGLVALRLVNIP